MRKRRNLRRGGEEEIIGIQNYLGKKKKAEEVYKKEIVE
jgi:hypothetical protein